MNKLIIFLCLSIAIQYCFANNEEEEWSNFKQKFNKKYKSAEEEQHRKETFVKNLKDNDEHNERFKNGLESYEVGINEFSDLKHEEFVNQMTTKLPRKPNLLTIQTRNISLRGPLPNYVNWVERGFNTTVQHQGYKCNSCYAFASAAAIEAQYYLKYGSYINVSEQDALDCSMFHGNLGCNGGWPSIIFEVAKSYGIGFENDFPYQEKETHQCVRNGLKPLLYVKEYYRLQYNDEQQLKEAVANVGPITVAIDATNLYNYREGIFFDQNCKTNSSTHIVLIVGYGTTKEGEDYWIFKNSYGASWGEAGYGRIARNKYNHCGVATNAVYPVLW